MSRIIIFNGDDPVHVADKFCAENGKFLKILLTIIGLDMKKRDKLVGVITTQMKQILPKIDEELETRYD
jgi:hypothetical protein